MSTATVAVETAPRSRAVIGTVLRSRQNSVQLPSPWIASHVIWCSALAVVGVVGQIVCWFGVSGEVTLREQLPWAGGAVLFAAVCAGAGIAWLGVGFFVLRRARREVFAETRAVFDLADPAGRASVIRPGESAAFAELVTAPSMTMAHRPWCLAARGKDVSPVGADEAARRGLSLCGICAS